MKTLFVLGNHPELSLAELRAILQIEPEMQGKEYAIFDIPAEKIPGLQDRLAGTVKIAEFLGKTTFTTDAALAEFLAPFTSERDGGKIIFGTSLYGEVSHIKPMRIGLELKKHLRQQGGKVRLVTSRHKQLSSADLLKNKVLENGFEFLLFPEGKEVLVARTHSFQPLEAWAKYDMERPARDMRRGMLPPKLARLMVNIAGVSEESILLDPFCGTGTVLEQAAVVGMKYIIGSDIDPKAMEDTKKNFDHLEIDLSPTLFTSAAKNVHTYLDPSSVTHIVTEPYLGKPRTGRETQHELAEEIEYLESLYAESFAGLKRILAPDATVVISIPRHYLGGNPLPDHITEAIEQVGFKKEFSHLYRHKDQFVGRNITVFRNI